MKTAMAAQEITFSTTHCLGVFPFQTRRPPCFAAHKVILSTVNLSAPTNFPLTQNGNLCALFQMILGVFHCQGLPGFEPRLLQPHALGQQV